MSQFENLIKNIVDEGLELRDIPGIDELRKLNNEVIVKQSEVEKFLTQLKSVADEIDLEDDNVNILVEDVINDLMWEYAYETGQEYDDGEFWTPSTC